MSKCKFLLCASDKKLYNAQCIRTKQFPNSICTEVGKIVVSDEASVGLGDVDDGCNCMVVGCTDEVTVGPVVDGAELGKEVGFSVGLVVAGDIEGITVG